MKRHLLLLLAAFGFLALIPTESKAQVTISVNPGYSNYGYYYQGQPRYYQGQRYYRGQRYYYYGNHRNQRYYRYHRYYRN